MTERLTVGSLFAGIGGFDLGFERAGFETVWQVEREPFCIAVLKKHFPNVERYYEIKDCGHGRKHKLRAVDIVTAGFPCQDLSVAGKRAGLAGTRSGLFWELTRILGELRPPWIVIENVPGLFSSNDGEDFAIVLRELGNIGYGLAWRVLDSQYFGVAQRRRRVFIVGCFGKPCPAEVLFESEGGEGDFAEGRETRPELAFEIAASLRGVGGGPRGFNLDVEQGLAVTSAIVSNGDAHSGFRDDGTSQHAVAFHENRSGHIGPAGNARALRSGASHSYQFVSTAAAGFCIGAGASAGTIGYEEEISPTLRGANGGNRAGVISAPTDPHGVRDLAELPEGLDSARYRALGNAVTANVAFWIAERIKNTIESEKVGE